MVTPRRESTHLYSDADTRPTLDLRRPDWMRDALCRDPEVLASVGGCFVAAEANDARRAAALQACGVCRVRVPCFDWALELPDQVGIAGGTTTAARRAIRANRKTRAKEITDAEPT
jgi:hypothetical protein